MIVAFAPRGSLLSDGIGKANIRKRYLIRGSTEVIIMRVDRPTQLLSPWANPGHLTTSCARGVGNLTFTWVGWGKLNQKCQASSDFLFRAPKSLIAVNTCLEEIEEFKGRDRTFVSDWLPKKGLQKL